jgi:hypothetical protein
VGQDSIVDLTTFRVVDGHAERTSMKKSNVKLECSGSALRRWVGVRAAVGDDLDVSFS